MRAPWMLLLVAAGCASRPAATDEGDLTTDALAERALTCVRATARAQGLQVRPSDPRDHWVIVADWLRSVPASDQVVIHVLPGSEGRPTVIANASGARPGTEARPEVRDAARAIEARCGGAYTR